MNGWKTYIAGAASIAWGIGGFVLSVHDVDACMGFVTGGLGLIGIRHKMEKASK